MIKKNLVSSRNRAPNKNLGRVWCQLASFWCRQDLLVLRSKKGCLFRSVVKISRLLSHRQDLLILRTQKSMNCNRMWNRVIPQRCGRDPKIAYCGRMKRKDYLSFPFLARTPKSGHNFRRSEILTTDQNSKTSSRAKTTNAPFRCSRVETTHVPFRLGSLQALQSLGSSAIA